MKINFDKALLQLTGDGMKDADGTAMTLGKVCTAALINDDTGDGIAKERRFRMAQKLFLGGSIELSVEDVAWLKEIVGRVISSTLHAGQARILLDGDV